MTEPQNEAQLTQPTRARRMWWLLPLAVLALLVAIIYLLVHLSSADSEMYPTTQDHCATSVRLC